MTEIIMALIGLGGTGLGYLVALRKNKAEADGVELDNVAHAIKIWKELAADLKSEMDELRIENDSLRLQLEALRASDSSQRNEIAQLHSELDYLKAKYGK